ncbi:hypothetical protein [Pseudomonas sp. MAG733B]|uniref:hypothetical protein n=1 Tax=unclassified Pseudomonas TaxID=196821 RepID=UPI0030D2740F
MKDQTMTPQRDRAQSENPGKPVESTPEPQSGDGTVDQKNRHTDNDNEFSPGFKPNPDRPKPSDDTDADIDTDGG